MKNKSEQKIAVLCDFTESMNGVILHGIYLAGFLEKELCLFALCGSNKQSKTEIHDHLSEIARTIKQTADHLVISTLVLKGRLRDQLELLADKYDAVLLLMNKERVSSKIKALQESHIPFLFVDGKTTDLISYNRVMLPVDMRKEMKETSLWASYLGRFNKAVVLAVYAKEKNRGNMSKVKKNLLFIKHFLDKTKVVHIFEQGLTNSWHIQFETMLQALEGKSDVLIILGSKHITPIDLMIGLPEKKIVLKAGKLPVLCINPSKDLHILCD